MGKARKAAVGPKGSANKEAHPGHYYPPELIAAAQQSERETGVPASVTLAQWAVESGWGVHSPNNNPFGMKASKSQPGQVLSTQEPSGLIKAKFRSFPTVEAAVVAHGEYVKRRFPWTMAHTDNPDDFVRSLQSHPNTSYAAESNYVKVITGLMRRDNLYQYDQKNQGNGGGGGGGGDSGGAAPVKMKDGETSVLLGTAMLMAAHVGSSHTGGGKLIEGSETVFVGPQQLQMSREGDASDDGYHLKTELQEDILVG